MQYLRTNILNINELDDLVTYFDSTYVSGCLRSTARTVGNQHNLVLRMTRSAAQFPPDPWNVNAATLANLERTYTTCARDGTTPSHSWLVKAIRRCGSLLRALQHDEVLVSTDLLQDARGQPPTKRIKESVDQHQQRLFQLCDDYRSGRKTLAQFLNGLGQRIRLINCWEKRLAISNIAYFMRFLV